MRERVRILLIGPCAPPVGGTSVSFGYLVAELRKRKECSVTVVSTETSGSKINKGLRAIVGIVKLTRMAGRHDVVGFHGSTHRFVVFGFLLRVVCWLHRKPLITRVFGGNLMDTYMSSGRLWRTMTLCVVTSEIVLVQSKEMFSIMKNKFPWADIRWFPTSRPTLSEGARCKNHGRPRRFVFLGHLRSDKGVNVILDAVESLDPATFRVEFFGGQAEEGLIEQIEKTASCKYGGELKPSEVLEKLMESDVLLFPSFYAGEGYPGVIIEAFHSRVPVIASDWKSIPELVYNGVNGLLVPARDAKSLSRAMERLIQDDKFLEALSDGARSAASAFASERWNGDKYIQFCCDAIGVL